MPQIHAPKISYETIKSSDANVTMPKDYIGPQLEKIGRTLETITEKENAITDKRVESGKALDTKIILESLRNANPESGNYTQFRNEAIFAYNELNKKYPEGALKRFYDRNPNYDDLFLLSVNGIIADKENEFFKNQYIDTRTQDFVKDTISSYDTATTPEASLKSANDYLKNSVYKEIDIAAGRDGKNSTEAKQKIAGDVYKFLIERAIFNEDKTAFDYYRTHQGLMPTITSQQWLDYQKQYDNRVKDRTSPALMTNDDWNFKNEAERTLKLMKDDNGDLDKEKINLGNIYRLNTFVTDPKSKFLEKKDIGEMRDIISLAGNVMTEVTTPKVEQGVVKGKGFWGWLGLNERQLQKTTLPNLLGGRNGEQAETPTYTSYANSLSEMKNELKKNGSEIEDGGKADFLSYVYITLKQGSGLPTADENIQATGLFPDTSSEVLDNRFVLYLGKLQDFNVYNQRYSPDKEVEEKLQDFKDFYKFVTGSDYVASEDNEAMRIKIFNAVNQGMLDPKKTANRFISKVFDTNIREKQQQIIDLRAKGN